MQFQFVLSYSRNRRQAYLYQIRPHTPHEVYIDKVWFGEERPQTCCFEFLPPFEELGEFLPCTSTEHVHFKLKLAKGQWLAMETIDENLERVEFVTLDVNLEHIDKVVAVPLHQSAQGIHFGIVSRAKGIFRTKGIGEKVGTAFQIRLEFNLWPKLTEMNGVLEPTSSYFDQHTYGVDTEIIAIDLTAGRCFHDIGFERGLAIYT